MKPRAKLSGQDGNIYNLIGIAQKALRREGMDDKADELFKEVHANAESYDEAIRIIMKYVEVY